jgi:citrate synthase
MAALFGERKCHAVIEMLQQIGRKENISKFLNLVKNKETDPSKMIDSQEPLSKNEPPKKPLRLMGFGHRVYKEGDPRVPLAKKLALELFELLGKDWIGQLALDFEELALKDEWIIQKKLLPNVDYWAAIIMHTFGFPKDMFTVIVAVPRL